MSQSLRKLVHVGTDVHHREIIRVVIPGHPPVRAEVIEVFDGIVLVEKENNQTSWVDAEYVFSTANE